MNYKINRNKYITLKLLERSKNKVNNDLTISEEEYNYLKNNFDEMLVCDPIIEGYYWYAGQDHPSINSKIVTDNVSSGWRLTGSTLDTYYSFSTTENTIENTPLRAESWYVALPVDTQYHLYDDINVISDNDFITDETVEFNGVTYKIYNMGVSPRLSGITIKK